MTQQEKKKAYILGVLALLFVAYWSYGHFKKAAPVKAAAPAGRQRVVKAPPRADFTVNLDLLDAKREPFTAKRNIFSPVYVKPTLPKPKPGGQAAIAPPAPLITVSVPPPPKSPEELARDNAREEMNKFRVLGMVQRKGRSDVLMQLAGNNFVAAKGEVITKQYYIADITRDTVVVKDKATGLETRIKANFEAAASKSGSSPVSGGMPGSAQRSTPGMGMPRPGMGGGRMTPPGGPR
ncbi:MAG TPA: hypothetical protein VGK71_04100 [Nitrospirota bacterium]|jgi:hypothetical protein